MQINFLSVIGYFRVAKCSRDSSLFIASMGLSYGDGYDHEGIAVKLLYQISHREVRGESTVVVKENDEAKN